MTPLMVSVLCIAPSRAEMHLGLCKPCSLRTARWETVHEADSRSQRTFKRERRYINTGSSSMKRNMRLALVNDRTVISSSKRPEVVPMGRRHL